MGQWGGSRNPPFSYLTVFETCESGNKVMTLVQLYWNLCLK
jgi:hypothetical protein